MIAIRRAPSEELYSWSSDVTAIDTSDDATRAVAHSLSVGGRYIFRTQPLHLPTAQAVTSSETASSSPPQPSSPASQPASQHALSNRVPGAHSAYSAPLLINISGPGAPSRLIVDAVGPHSLVLEWAAPPFAPSDGVWHSDGGLPLVGYRVLLYHANQARRYMTLPLYDRYITLPLYHANQVRRYITG